VKTHIDTWKRLVADTWNLEFMIRSDWDIVKDLRWGTWLKVNDKDLGTGGRSQDYGESVEYEYDYSLSGLYISDFSDLSVSDVGSGMKVDYGNRLTSTFIPLTRMTAYYKISWVDENATNDYPQYDTQFARRYVTAFATTVSPIKPLRLKTRIRLEDQYMLTDARGDKLWEVYFQALGKIDKWASLSARYDFRQFIDDNPPEQNPEHLFRFIADFRF